MSLAPASPTRQDATIEAAVLGTILRCGDADEVTQALAVLEPRDFAEPKNAAVFMAIRDLYRDDKPIDLVGTHLRLKTTGQLARAGCELYLAGLLDHEITAINLAHYVADLRAMTTRRAAVQAAGDIQRLAGDPGQSVDAFMDNATAILDRVRACGSSIAKGPLVDADRQWHPMGDRVDHDPPEREFLLETPYRDGPQAREPVGILPCNVVAAIAAAGGVGKTQLLCQLGVAVACGKPWLGAFTVRRPGRVLLILAEEDEAEAHRRVRFAVATMKLGEEDRDAVARNLIAIGLAGHSVMFGDDNGEPAFYRGLLRRLRKEADLRLVALDCASRFAPPAAEVDNAAATRFVEMLEAIRLEAPGHPVVMLARHTSQAARQQRSSDATAGRGVTGLYDGLRWEAILKPEPGYPNFVDFRITKSNYGPVGHRQTLVKDRGAFRRATGEELEKAGEEAVARAHDAAAEASKCKTNRRKGTNGKAPTSGGNGSGHNGNGEETDEEKIERQLS